MRIMASLFARSVLGDAKEPELIGELLGAAAGVFGEVGANDPVLLSQTYRLEQLGWNGILIEPLRECADKLRAAGRARIYEVAAGAPEDEGRELPLLVAGALSTLRHRRSRIRARAKSAKCRFGHWIRSWPKSVSTAWIFCPWTWRAPSSRY